MVSRRAKYLPLIIALAVITAASAWPREKKQDREDAAVPAPVAPTPVAATSSSSVTAPSIIAIATTSIPSVKTTSTPAIKPVIPKASSLILSVPFTSQAPFGGWSDERQQDGCEEASVAMAISWAKGEKDIPKEEWLKRILAISDFEKEKYGEYRDVSLVDVVNWVIKDYYGYDISKVEIKDVASSSDILAELESGQVVLIPTDGQALHNPYFTAPGPERHMVLIKGYDYKTQKFITNDPGTRHGENYRYSPEVIYNSIRPYVTGYHLPFPSERSRQMIVISK